MSLKYKLISYFIREKTKRQCHKILLETNTYFQGLSDINKQIFVIRTLLFIWTTNFHSKPGFEVTQRIKIIISSAFVQITFGLKVDTLDTFNDIFVAPQSYSYKNNKAMFNGDVNLITKKVNLAWPAVERGFKISDDALNLCIHEFGHCLIFENASRSYFTRIFDASDFDNWREKAEEKMLKIKSNENKVLRSYAGTNLIEFFSVALETFFEKPDYFAHHEPELYLSMTYLLNQNPRINESPKLN